MECTSTSGAGGGADLKHLAHVRHAGDVPARDVLIEIIKLPRIHLSAGKNAVVTGEELAHIGDARDVPAG